MSNPDPGPGTGPTGDRNLRPRRTSTTRTFFDPSPSATSLRQPKSASTQVNTHYHTRTASGSLPPGQGDESTKDLSDSSSEGGNGLQEVSKLEVKREKNRLKQRNLRQRRANHINQLEDQVRHLKRDCTTFRDHITTKSTIVSANDTKYRSWITGLESVLYRQGLGDEVEGLRHAWASAIQPIPPFPHTSRPVKGSRKSKVAVKTEPLELEMRGPLGDQLSRIDTTSRRGSISTLVQAAIAADTTHITPTTGYSMNQPANNQVIYSGHGHHQLSANQYMRAPTQSDLSVTHSSHIPPAHNMPRVSTVYPGSLEALRQPPSPSRYVHRARTIPTSARPTWPTQETRVHHPNLPPPEPEDRKRKRSLSGPTLHTGTYQPIPPMFSYSAPSSGQVDQSRSMMSHGEPPSASLPGPATRPTSSHQVGQSRPSSWNTLAPFRLPAMSSSRPSTPSVSMPIASPIDNPSPQHIKISDLLEDRAGDNQEYRQVPAAMEGTPKSHSWPVPAARGVNVAMPISDLLMRTSEARRNQAEPSTHNETPRPYRPAQ